jgi:hypothetical protein
LRSSSAFPRLTWVRCECGCGFEGEDDVAQFLLEEALVIAATEQEHTVELAGAQENELRAAIEQAKTEARKALEGR